MWWHKKPSPKNLEEWLEIATKNIVPLEAEAIAQEIRNHYQDELEFQMSYGKTQAEAEKIALNELGNSIEANKQFCETHITQNEWIRLTKEKKNSSIFLGIVAILLITLGVFGVNTFQLGYIFGMVFSRAVEAYYLERGELLQAVKNAQKALLASFPVASMFVISGIFINKITLVDPRVYVIIVQILVVLALFFETIKATNNTIWKFQRYFQKYPAESQMKG